MNDEQYIKEFNGYNFKGRKKEKENKRQINNNDNKKN